MLFSRLATLSTIILPTIAQISLTEFQAIADFTIPCTNAYSQTITGCSPQDFTQSSGCSANCIVALLNVQKQIQAACGNVAVDPGSVIGHFFANSGPAFVCSGIPLHDNGGGSQSSSSTSPEVTVTTMTTFTVSSRSTSTTSQAAQTTKTHSSDAASTSSTSTRAAETQHSTSTTTTASSSTSSATPGHSASFFKTAVNEGSATTFTSQAQQTSSSNPDRFGGGGSPFEISRNVAGDAHAEKSLWLLVAMIILGIGGPMR